MKPRLSWLIVVVVVCIVTAVPVLRHHARLAWLALKPIEIESEEGVPPETFGPPSYLRVLSQLRPYQATAIAFVEEHYPDDPRMLTAAALLGDDDALLKRAAELGEEPIAWAAYADHLMSRPLGFERLGSGGVDPEDAVAMQEERWRIAQAGLPDRLSPEETEPLLEAVRRWQAADPDNALPVVCEFLYLRGLHEDTEAFRAWQRAALLPELTSHPTDRLNAITDLLVAMGLPEAEAHLAAWAGMRFASLSRLRHCARIAVYQGRVAQIEGRPNDAVAWWQSTFDLGRHVQDSSEELIEWLVGSAVMGIGAAHVWRWTPDGASGIPNGPLLGGRIFYGPQHDFYLSVMGAEADEDMRAALVTSKVRSSLWRRSDRPDIMGEYELAAGYLRYGGVLLLAFVALLLAFAALGSWSRRAADNAVRPGPLWDPVLVGLVLLPLAAGALAMPFVSERLPARVPDLPDIIPFDIPIDSIDFGPVVFFGPLALSVALAVFLTLLGGVIGRTPGAALFAAWRGYIRRTFPPVLAVFAVIFLLLIVGARNIREDWVAYWRIPGNTAMSWTIEQLGPEWHNPTIPPDAWRAAPPPPPPPPPLSPGGRGMRGSTGRGAPLARRGRRP